MKADWDDAPLRMRSGQEYRSMKYALLLMVGTIGLGSVATIIMPAAVTSRETARPEQPTNLISTPAPPASVTQQRPGSSANDPYLDQVNRMLGITGNHASEPIAHIEWSDSQQSNTTPRQRVFSDSNYTPVTSINTIRMPSPQPTQAPTPRRPQPYVTVVKETKLSCWPHKEGSAACRRYKARMHQIHRRNCDLRGNSQSISCQLANRYDLR